MPYIIKKATENGKTGYRVCKRENPKRCFSEHVLTEEKAKKQRTAIIMSEMGLSRRKGGAGSDEENMPEDIPKTIPLIKEALNYYGYNTEVFDLSIKKPAPKKEDWQKLYIKCYTSYQKMRPSLPKGTFVSGPEEAFMKMNLGTKTKSKSRS